MKRVLIVDDHDLFREVLATVLQLDTHLKQNVQAESSLRRASSLEV
jgi:DNA-binding NarL/FixJ family response regulator